jgi:ribosome recycling factor
MEPIMIDETLFEAEEKMEKAIEVLREDFAGIRTGRVHPAMFAKVLVDYYGAPTPLQQLASFTVPEARVLLIKPVRQELDARIEKALARQRLRRQPEQ